MTSRVKAVIDSRWLKLYDEFKTQILVDLTKVSSENDVEKEADINWFVWKDLIGETVIESRSDVVKVMNSLMKGKNNLPWAILIIFLPLSHIMCGRHNMFSFVPLYRSSQYSFLTNIFFHTTHPSFLWSIYIHLYSYLILFSHLT